MGKVGLIRSPDGRVWALDRIRPKSSEAETFKVPFFWTSVVVIRAGRPETDVKGAPLVRSG